MGLQKFRKIILKATHNHEFLAVLVFPDSSITLDIRMSNLDILVSKLDICINKQNEGGDEGDDDSKM